MIKRVIASTAALALVSTPVMAQASLAERAPTPVEDSEEIAAGSGILIAVLAAAAVIAGIIIIADDDDEPASP